MESQVDLNHIIFAVIGVILVLLLGIFLIFSIAVRNKNRLLLEKENTRLTYEAEINKMRVELQDQTLSDIGRELHDDIGQLITVLRIQVNSLSKTFPGNVKVNEVLEVVTLTSEKVRNISHSLNHTRISDFGLERELNQEILRIGKTGKLKATLEIKGNINVLKLDQQIILYRIIQEFISNSLKYSDANLLQLFLTFNDRNVEVKISDDGIGFDRELTMSGSGLRNIEYRAKLLKAFDLQWITAIGKGTCLIFLIPLTD